MLKELCCASVEALNASVKYQLDRIELCQCLEVGGLTPSSAFIRQAVDLHPNVQVLIRNRQGNFVYSDDEKELMISEALEAMNLGAKGIVIGALTKEMKVDIDFISKVRRVVGGELTFHRAFDDLNNFEDALVLLKNSGVNRILTSGGKVSVSASYPLLKDMISLAGNEIEIQLGGGVNATNVKEIVESLKPHGIHFSATEIKKDESSKLFVADQLVFSEEKLKAILSQLA